MYKLAVLRILFDMRLRKMIRTKVQCKYHQSVFLIVGVAQFISLLKNAVKTSSLEKDALCFIPRESSAPIGKEKDREAPKCEQSTRKQPKRRQKGLVLAPDDAYLLVFSAAA